MTVTSTARSFRTIADGSVTSARGFRAGALAAGIKASGKPDLGIWTADCECVAAGTFTPNKFPAAPVILSRARLAASDSRAQAVVFNAGNANACNGQQGLADAQEMSRLTADQLGISPDLVMVASTGIIGVPMPMDRIRQGIPRLVLRPDAGHDAARVPPLFEMYRDAGLMSRECGAATRAVRPYTGHSANAFGEGAVTLVLETREHAEHRGARILAKVVGYRYGNGGDHPTDVDFTGGRPAQLIGEALEEGELTAMEVDFVLGHGNGVQTSDLSELNYMKRVFGRRTRDVPLISTKPIYGHTLGASSAINAAAAALMLHNEFVIPTINIDESSVVRGFNHQANRGAPRANRSGIVMSYGIGGQNAALVMRRNG